MYEEIKLALSGVWIFLFEIISWKRLKMYYFIICMWLWLGLCCCFISKYSKKAKTVFWWCSINCLGLLAINTYRSCWKEMEGILIYKFWYFGCGKGLDRRWDDSPIRRFVSGQQLGSTTHHFYPSLLIITHLTPTSSILKTIFNNSGTHIYWCTLSNPKKLIKKSISFFFFHLLIWIILYIYIYLWKVLSY